MLVKSSLSLRITVYHLEPWSNWSKHKTNRTPVHDNSSVIPLLLFYVVTLRVNGDLKSALESCVKHGSNLANIWEKLFVKPPLFPETLANTLEMYQVHHMQLTVGPITYIVKLCALSIYTFLFLINMMRFGKTHHMSHRVVLQKLPCATCGGQFCRNQQISLKLLCFSLFLIHFDNP